MIVIQGLDYLNSVREELVKKWPANRTVNVVCHGHSVPAGYFATPVVNTFSSYPHLLHQIIKDRFPFAVVNVIVTAIGGETSRQGAERFHEDVLTHKPDILTLDYGLNDRSIGLEAAEKAWGEMISAAKERGIHVILCTPTWDRSYLTGDEQWRLLVSHAEQIRRLADRYDVGLADNFEVFRRAVSDPADLARVLSHVNHPSEVGHRLAANEIAKYFPAK
jgi:lysophospholipase L1-like esterase